MTTEQLNRGIELQKEIGKLTGERNLLIRHRDAETSRLVLISEYHQNFPFDFDRDYIRKFITDQINTIDSRINQLRVTLSYV